MQEDQAETIIQLPGSILPRGAPSLVAPFSRKSYLLSSFSISILSILSTFETFWQLYCTLSDDNTAPTMMHRSRYRRNVLHECTVVQLKLNTSLYSVAELLQLLGFHVVVDQDWCETAASWKWACVAAHWSEWPCWPLFTTTKWFNDVHTTIDAYLCVLAGRQNLFKKVTCKMNRFGTDQMFILIQCTVYKEKCSYFITLDGWMKYVHIFLADVLSSKIDLFYRCYWLLCWLMLGFEAVCRKYRKNCDCENRVTNTWHRNCH